MQRKVRLYYNLKQNNGTVLQIIIICRKLHRHKLRLKFYVTVKKNSKIVHKGS